VYFGYPKVNVIKSSKDAFLHFKDLGFSATEIFAVPFPDIKNSLITFKRLMKARKIFIHSSLSQRKKSPGYNANVDIFMLSQFYQKSSPQRPIANLKFAQ
jgi:hypothetical protein